MQCTLGYLRTLYIPSPEIGNKLSHTDLVAAERLAATLAENQRRRKTGCPPTTLISGEPL
jgi:hypothetical protein